MFSKSLDLSRKREKMVAEQLEARGIKDEKVLAAFKKVAREAFVPIKYRDQSYGDYPIPIGSDQTISQPYMVALMTELLDIKKGDKVLEIGTGSGYQTAILAELSSDVYTIERVAVLGEKAKELLWKSGYTNISLKVDDGSCGWQEYAPYNAILATCGAPSVPEPFKEQLAEGGRLVIPVGSDLSQVLTIVKKEGSGFEEIGVCDCVFVPLIGRYGWRKYD